MIIVKFIFLKKDALCEMYVGGKKVEIYSILEGQIALSAMQELKIAAVIHLEVENK